MYQAVKLYKEAIDAYIAGEMWPHARRLAKDIAPKYVFSYFSLLCLYFPLLSTDSKLSRYLSARISGRLLVFLVVL